ncbi:hypothetical protein N780_01285 [Pontibacillus chungwhensis BH030062]|uniref:Uncharacterized protein n=1 Tax=Pontibacillus chungwhensis BH030062 TaxID=1385513 RepID=A0A0A2VFK1_9BACI|nr:hypothetical protein N780_01285 [Pontibacillus chungwhensis BH030062]
MPGYVHASHISAWAGYTKYGMGGWGTSRLLREKEVDETPQRALANEEARQLARGKRVVPQSPLPLLNANGPFHLASSLPHNLHIWKT